MFTALWNAVLVGLVVGTAVNMVAYLGRPVGFWGTVWGVMVAIVTFGAVLTFSRQGAAARARGRAVAAGGLALIGLGTFWWMIIIGMPRPWTLEGLWLWPLAVGTLVAAAIVGTWGRGHRGRRQRNDASLG
ncbi:MAG: hypothetical protein M3O86_01260 [Actinomycetota bacterium]|nr:hypothetical protein [Actinomycetota bacterium]